MSTEIYVLLGGLFVLAVIAAYWKGRHDEGSDRDIQSRNEANPQMWQEQFESFRKAGGNQ